MTTKKETSLKATDVLRHEHQIVLMVLDSADAVVRSNKFHLDSVEQMVGFFKVFADRCHHMKEEQHLFPKLVMRGMSEDAILFPMSDAILTQADQEELTGAFEKAETEEIGADVHERYHQLAHDLKKSLSLQE